MKVRERRTETLSIRLTKSNMELLRSYAEQNSASLADVINYLIEKEMKKNDAE